jgi:hypothetical protein
MPAVLFASAVIKGEDYVEAERPLRDRSRFDEHDGEAIWWLITTLRHQGRISEALTLTAQAAQFAAAEGRSGALWHYVEAVLLFELGRFEEAAAQFHGLMRGGRTILQCVRPRRELVRVHAPRRGWRKTRTGCRHWPTPWSARSAQFERP